MRTYDPNVDPFSQSVAQFFSGRISYTDVLPSLQQLSAEDLFAISKNYGQTRLFFVITECNRRGGNINDFVYFIKDILLCAASAYPFESEVFVNGVQWMLHQTDFFNLNAVRYARSHGMARALDIALSHLPTFIFHAPPSMNFNPRTTTAKLILGNFKAMTTPDFDSLSIEEYANYLHCLMILVRNRQLLPGDLYQLFMLKNTSGYRLLETFLRYGQHPLKICMAFELLKHLLGTGILSVAEYNQVLFFNYDPTHCLMHMLALQHPVDGFYKSEFAFCKYLDLVIEAQKKGYISLEESLQIFLNVDVRGRSASAQLIDARSVGVAVAYQNFLHTNPLGFSAESLLRLTANCNRNRTKKFAAALNKWIINKHKELQNMVACNTIDRRESFFATEGLVGARHLHGCASAQVMLPTSLMETSREEFSPTTFTSFYSLFSPQKAGANANDLQITEQSIDSLDGFIVSELQKGKY